MANRSLTADVIAAEALMQLDNNLVMANKCYRAEDDFSKSVNGYAVGDTVNFRRPAQFELREGRIAAPQDVVEGKQSLVVNQQWGIDFQFTSEELSLDIKDVSKRVIKPAMVKLANKIDQDLMGLYASVPWWVGTPGQTINSYSDFLVGVQRLDDMAVPLDDRHAVLAPADFHGLLGAASGLFIQPVAEEAYRDRKLGELAGVNIAMAQNVPSHTVGSAATASAVADAAAGNGVLSTVYDTVKDNDQLYMYLSTDGWDASTLKAGDVLELATTNVKAVNPITKVAQSFNQQFVVLEQAKLQAEVQKAQLSVAEKQLDLRLKGVQLESHDIDNQLKGMQLEAQDPRVVFGEQMQAMQASMQQLTSAVQALAQQMMSPKNVVRGPDGRAVGVESNGRMREVVRDENGLIQTLQ